MCEKMLFNSHMYTYIHKMRAINARNEKSQCTNESSLSRCERNSKREQRIIASTYIYLSNFPSALQLNQSEKCFTFRVFFLDFPFLCALSHNTHTVPYAKVKLRRNEWQPKNVRIREQAFHEDRWQMATVNLCACSTQPVSSL